MTEIVEYEVVRPEWAKGRTLDEVGFCREFLLRYPLAWVDGQFFSHAGHVPEEQVRKYLYDYLTMFLSGNISGKVGGLLEVLKLECRQISLPLSETKIVCANGTYDLNRMELIPTRDFCRYRLPVDYNPEAPEPKLWLSFLQDLLEEEDILTLQEFLGYCLVPVNYAQKMLILIGKGGEGKSRIGIVLRHLLGEGMCNGSIAKVETSPFARADLQHRLVMVDDDLRLEALNSTSYLKSMVTAEQPMDLERKGKQSYQGEMHCRFLAFGNGHLRALHDRSYGFFRRQIILTTKERRRDRVDDPFLAQRLRGELEGILLWAIAGLERLLENNMCFTVSEKTRQNMNSAILDSNNVVDFMDSQGYFRFDPQAEATSRSLYNCYKDWCDDNMHNPLSPKSFTAYLMQAEQSYNITYSRCVHGGSGRYVRGFKGIRVCR